MPEFKVGDRVKWIAWRKFGTEPVVATGTIENVSCGVPFFHDPPQYHDVEGMSWMKEAGRHPAAQIKPDREQTVHEKPIVVALKDLEHAE